MKVMTKKQIEKAISNVNTSLAVERLVSCKETIIQGRKILEGTLDIEDAVRKTTQSILNKKRKLIKV